MNKYKVLLIVGAIGFASILKTYSQSSLPLYHPDLDFFQKQIQKGSANYEGGYQSVCKSYDFLLNLQLFNKANIETLNLYKARVKKEASKWTGVDFSIPANVNEALMIINQYYNGNQSIQDEVSLLNKLFTEIDNLKVLYPSNFNSTDRYKELISVITELQTCNPDKIRELGWKHGLL